VSTFRFRLERVLRLRTRHREEAADQHARARAALRAVEAGIAAARAAQAAARAAEEGAGREITAADLLTCRAWEEAHAARERTLETERVRAADEVERRRLALLGRRRDERVLERLREHAVARHAADEARAEQIHLDELALRGARTERGQER
jgi:flagellar export protein FliJ